MTMAMRRILVAVVVLAASCSSSTTSSNGLVGGGGAAGGGPTAGRGPIVPPAMGVDGGSTQVDGAAAAVDAGAAAAIDGPPAPDASRPLDAAALEAPRDLGAEWSGPDGKYSCRLCCGTAPEWKAIGAYRTGDDVVHFGHLFYCKGESANYQFCNGATYEPGRADSAWMQVWTLLGECAVPQPPASQCTMCVP